MKSLSQIFALGLAVAKSVDASPYFGPVPIHPRPAPKSGGRKLRALRKKRKAERQRRKAGRSKR